MWHQVGVGDQHARCVAVGLEHTDRLARLHQQGFVVFQAGQGFDDLVVARPVARRAADTAVYHQLFRVFRDLWIEVVHQHAQWRFGQPAFGGQLVATWGTDFNVTVFVVVGHGKGPLRSSAGGYVVVNIQTHLYLYVQARTTKIIGPFR
ncbi:hypothetical protein D9M73_231750 [compost metagenome]